MTSNLGFASTSLSIYRYEPFSFTWTYPGASSMSFTPSTVVAPYVTVSNTSNVVFASATGINFPASTESLVIQALDAGSSVLATSSNVISLNNARFVSDVSTSLAGASFTFYKNEPIVPTIFSAAFPLTSAPSTTPSLPFGLSFVSNTPSQYALTGTPLVQTPLSNYNIVGSNLPKVASTSVSMVVNLERVVIDVSGTGIVSQMEIGTAITPQVLTARCPPYPRAGGDIRYTWTPLPIGLVFTDINNVVRSSPFTPSDASATLILKGTPTVEGAKEFIALGLSQASVGVTATRITSPIISNSQALTFSFAETVLFDDVTVPTLYTDLPLNPTATAFRARTYFGANAAITTIFSPNLRTDLSLNFVSGQGLAYLTGTPTSAGTATYTIRASNANSISRDLSQSIVISNDSVTVSSVADVCYNFIVGRSVSNAKTGYYPSPIAWTATVASSQSVTFSAPALTGTGLGLSVSGNVATLTGTPTTPLSLRNLRVTATAATTLASGFLDTSFGIVADQFTITNDTSTGFVFLQNETITPVRFSATTLSDRSIQSYSSIGLPAGLKLTFDGVLQGAPVLDTSGTFSIVASTGSTTGSQSYPFTVQTDTILFPMSPTAYTYGLTGSVSIPILAISYTGNPVTNYALVGLPSSYGLSINPMTGLLSGTLSSSIPIGDTPFSITADSGYHTGTVTPQIEKTASTVTIRFPNVFANGPTIVTPTQFESTIYQFVQITPIQITATGTGTIRYYLRLTDLPVGFTFDSVTATLSGKAMERGVHSFTVYAEDETGVTAIPFRFNAIFPTITRGERTPASAYTSLMRQYTVVNAARNAENNVVYPSETRTIGEFARQYPPDETTATVDPKCYSTSNCT